MTNNNAKNRLLILVVAYNAQDTIESVLARIPISISQNYSVEVLIIDDSSQDDTFHEGRRASQILKLPFPVHVLKNPINQGYGGNQKIGYHYAMEFCFDYVALIHGDGQYAPETLPDLMKSFDGAGVCAVLGSRMLTRGSARAGGMPLYKFVGNKILSGFENYLLNTNFSEFHSGYRIYSVAALRQVPFNLNTNDFHFDTEIIIQFVARGLKIVEQPIPTYYGDEICRVNGMKYAKDVAVAVLRFRAQGLGIFYDRRFDLQAESFDSNEHYQVKFDGISPHTLTFAKVRTGAKVVDMGCAAGYVGSWLQEHRQCDVVGVDQFTHPHQAQLKQFIQHHISDGLPAQLDSQSIDYVLMLDVIEHLPSPERFVQKLAEQLSSSPQVELLVSTGNVAFIVTRLMLLFGQFNYGKRGILDITHTRLFTFSSMRHLFEQAGFEVTGEQGVPVPLGLVFNNKALVKALLWVNQLLIKVSKGLFSYQMYMTVKPKPGLAHLLKNAQEHSAKLV